MELHFLLLLKCLRSTQSPGINLQLHFRSSEVASLETLNWKRSVKQGFSALIEVAPQPALEPWLWCDVENEYLIIIYPSHDLHVLLQNRAV